MSEIEDKLDKIIKLLEEIRANQPIPYYPPIQVYPVIYPPQPYMPYPWDGTTWTEPAICKDSGTVTYYPGDDLKITYRC